MSSIKEDYRQELSKLLRETKIPESDSKKQKLAKYSALNGYITKNMPKSLFRYREYAPHNLKALRDGSIPVTKPSEMGDIFDSQIVVDIERVVAEIKGLENNSDTIANYFYEGNPIPSIALNMVSRNVRRVVLKNHRLLKKNIWLRANAKKIGGYVGDNLTKYANEERDKSFDILRKTGYIACFCVDVNGVTMRDRFAGKHTGYALEYDFEALNARFPTIELTGNRIKQPNYIVLPAIYGEIYDSTELVFVSLLNRLLREHSNKDTYIKHPDELCRIKGYLHKSRDYESEAEWRLITPMLNSVSPESDLYSRVSGVPTAIYYGAKIADDVFRELDEIAVSKGLRRYRMETNPSNASVVAVSL